MVVIGDPTAETVLKVKLAGCKCILTPNTHQPSLFSGEKKKLKLSKQHGSASQAPPPPPSLPALCISLGASSFTLTSAMYSGNASSTSPQRHQVRAILRQIEAYDVDFEIVPLRTHPSGHKILSLPIWEIYRHSKTTGKVERDSSYVQLDFDEVFCALSLPQMAKIFFLLKSWNSPSLSSSDVAKFSLPSFPNNLGHLQLTLKDATLTHSSTDEFSLSSFVLSSCSIVLLRDSQTGRLCHAVPVLYGPLRTEEWNSVEAYHNPPSHTPSSSSSSSSSHSPESLIEMFTSSPQEKFRGIFIHRNLFFQCRKHLLKNTKILHSNLVLQLTHTVKNFMFDWN